MMYQVNLDDLVPKDNYYWLISKEINFSFLSLKFDGYKI